MKLAGAAWHSSFGVLLDRCCLCRVQVGVDDRGRFIEFDGFPHRCSALGIAKSLKHRQLSTRGK